MLLNAIGKEGREREEETEGETVSKSEDKEIWRDNQKIKGRQNTVGNHIAHTHGEISLKTRWMKISFNVTTWKKNRVDPHAGEFVCLVTEFWKNLIWLFHHLHELGGKFILLKVKRKVVSLGVWVGVSSLKKLLRRKEKVIALEISSNSFLMTAKYSVLWL